MTPFSCCIWLLDVGECQKPLPLNNIFSNRGAAINENWFSRYMAAQCYVWRTQLLSYRQSVIHFCRFAGNVVISHRLVKNPGRETWEFKHILP